MNGADEMQVIEVRKIHVKDDYVLEVELTQEFIDRLRKHYDLTSEQPLEDRHVKLYVLGAVESAVNKAEHEQRIDRM